LVPGLIDEPQELGEIDGLLEDLPEPGPAGRVGRLAVGVAGDEDGHGTGPNLLDLAVEDEAIHPRQLEVEEGDVEGMRRTSSSAASGSWAIASWKPKSARMSERL
jgi:hypothetical protein